MFGLLKKKPVIKVGQRYAFTGDLFKGHEFDLKLYSGKNVSLYNPNNGRNFRGLVQVANPKNITEDEWQCITIGHAKDFTKIN